MLITLEGIDGSGKTSAWEALQDADVVPGDAVFTREPTDSWYGDAVYQSISDPDADPLAELFLYTADHADHLSRVVRPALDDGNVVISDRYADSRYAYQGATLEGVLEDPLDYVQQVHAPWSRPPDATIFLDIDPVTGAERAGATNKFEQVEYLGKVRSNYERLIEQSPERFTVVDASQPHEDVLAAVENAVAERL